MTNDNRVETEQHKAWVSQVYANYHYAGMTQQAAIEVAGPEPVKYEIEVATIEYDDDEHGWLHEQVGDGWEL